MCVCVRLCGPLANLNLLTLISLFEKVHFSIFFIHNKTFQSNGLKVSFNPSQKGIGSRSNVMALPAQIGYPAAGC